MIVPRKGFINVDLELTGTEELTALVEALSGAMYLLNTVPVAPGDDHGGRFAVLELHHSGGDTPESTIRDMVDAIRALQPDAQRVWRTCEKRVFSIGFNSMKSYPAAAYTIAPELVAEIAALDAAIEVVIYPPEDAKDFPSGVQF